MHCKFETHHADHLFKRRSVVDLHIPRYAEAVADPWRQSKSGRVQVLVNKASTTVDSVTRATALPTNRYCFETVGAAYVVSSDQHQNTAGAAQQRLIWLCRELRLC